MSNKHFCQGLSQMEINMHEIYQGVLLGWGLDRRRGWILAQPCGTSALLWGSSEAGIILQNGLKLGWRDCIFVRLCSSVIEWRGSFPPRQSVYKGVNSWGLPPSSMPRSWGINSSFVKGNLSGSCQCPPWVFHSINTLFSPLAPGLTKIKDVVELQ